MLSFYPVHLFSCLSCSAAVSHQHKPWYHLKVDEFHYTAPQCLTWQFNNKTLGYLLIILMAAKFGKTQNELMKYFFKAAEFSSLWWQRRTSKCSLHEWPLIVISSFAYALWRLSAIRFQSLGLLGLNASTSLRRSRSWFMCHLDIVWKWKTIVRFFLRYWRVDRRVSETLQTSLYFPQLCRLLWTVSDLLLVLSKLYFCHWSSFISPHSPPPHTHTPPCYIQMLCLIKYWEHTYSEN